MAVYQWVVVISNGRLSWYERIKGHTFLIAPYSLRTFERAESAEYEREMVVLQGRHAIETFLKQNSDCTFQYWRTGRFFLALHQLVWAEGGGEHRGRNPFVLRHEVVGNFVVHFGNNRKPGHKNMRMIGSAEVGRVKSSPRDHLGR